MTTTTTAAADPAAAGAELAARLLAAAPAEHAGIVAAAPDVNGVLRAAWDTIEVDRPWVPGRHAHAQDAIVAGISARAAAAKAAAPPPPPPPPPPALGAQHHAVRDSGPARKNGRIRFRGGATGVELHDRDESVIGYPIPLDTGQFLLAERFGRHRYHEDASPMWFALGRTVGRAKAQAALDAHVPTQRARIEAAGESMGYDPDTGGRPRAAELGRTTYYVGAESTVAVTVEYDWPPAGRLIRQPRAEVLDMLRRAGAAV